MARPVPTTRNLGSLRLRVTIEGIRAPLDGFIGVSAITSSTERIRTAPEDVILEREYAGLDEFAQWHHRIINGPIDRRVVSIEFLRDDGATVRTWSLVNAYPSRWVLPPMDADGSSPAVEVITLSAERVVQEL